MATIEEREAQNLQRKQNVLGKVKKELKSTVVKLCRRLPDDPWSFISDEFRRLQDNAVSPDQIDINTLFSKEQKAVYLAHYKVNQVLGEVLMALMNATTETPFSEMAVILDGKKRNGALVTSKCDLPAAPAPVVDSEVIKVQALFRGRIARKSISMESRLGAVPITESSITPEKARKYSNPPKPDAALVELPAQSEEKTEKSTAEPTAEPTPTETTEATAAADSTTIEAEPTTAAEPTAAEPTELTPTETIDSIAIDTEGITLTETTETDELAQTTKMPTEETAENKTEETEMEKMRREEAEREQKKRDKLKDSMWGTEAAIEAEPEEEEAPLPTDEKGIREELARIRGLLSSVESAWGLRVKALNRIEEAVRFIKLPLAGSTCDDLQSWKAELETMVPMFAVQVNELRSSIVREVCRLLLSLGADLGSEMVVVVTALIPNLYANTYVTVKVISESSKTCLNELMTRVPSMDYLPTLLKGFEDIHAAARAACCRCIGIIMKTLPDDPKWSADDSGLLNQVTTELPNWVNDISPETRTAAKTVFLTFKNTWPETAAEMFKKFDARTQKLLTPKAKASSKKGPVRISFKQRMMMEQKKKAEEAAAAEGDVVVAAAAPASGDVMIL